MNTGVQLLKFWQINPLLRKWMLIFFLLLFTLFNFTMSAIGRAHINIGLLAWAPFIAWGLWSAPSISRRSLLIYLGFIILLSIATAIGLYRHNVWLGNDFVKLFLIGTGAFVYFNLFSSREEFTYFVKAICWLLVITTVTYIPFCSHEIYLNSRLVIPSIGVGGEDLGWISAASYILFSLIVAHSESKWRRIDDILAILIMTILLLTLSRAAMIAVFIYCVATKEWRFVLHGFIATLITVPTIIAALHWDFLLPSAFIIQNGHRFLPGSILRKLYLYVAQTMPEKFNPHVIELVKKTVTSTSTQANHQEAIATITPVFYKNWVLTGRSLIWWGFIKYFLQAPLFNQMLGFGVGSVTLKVVSAGFLSRDPHNLFIDILYNFGLVGLAALLAGIGWSIYYFIKQRAPEPLAIIMTIIIAGLFNSVWRYSSLLWLTSLFIMVPYFYQKFYRDR